MGRLGSQKLVYVGCLFGGKWDGGGERVGRGGVGIVWRVEVKRGKREDIGSSLPASSWNDADCWSLSESGE